ncbi:hypothetical protein ACX0G9_09535 [Flavitalea flava]
MQTNALYSFTIPFFAFRRSRIIRDTHYPFTQSGTLTLAVPVFLN